MQTFRLTVGPDGRVAIPDTRPGQTVTVQVGQEVAPEAPARLTLATARTDAEREVVAAEIKRLARELRAELPEPWRSRDHGDLLYGDDGLPS